MRDVLKNLDFELSCAGTQGCQFPASWSAEIRCEGCYELLERWLCTSCLGEIRNNLEVRMYCKEQGASSLYLENLKSL